MDDADAGAATQGTCGVVSTGNDCTLFVGTCAFGDTCNPNNNTNQGYDPCYYKVAGQNLRVRTGSTLICHSDGTNGYCSTPVEGEPCVDKCTQTPGDTRATGCIDFFEGGKRCMPSCKDDTECTGAAVYDQQNYNPQPVTNFCMNYGTASGCQPNLCFAEGVDQLDDPSVLYKPCADHPDTICVPQYTGDLSTIIGYCMATRKGATSTVGKLCDSLAGVESSATTCGPDAICLGGRCAAICDAAQLGGNDTPACGAGRTCISPQNVNLIADYQVGGCGISCDPFTDLEHSGCVNYCGGPPSRCEWIVGDSAGGPDAPPRGFCGAAIKTPIKVGKACTRTNYDIDPCEAGARCLLSSNGTSRTCVRLCDPTAEAGSPDSCPDDQTCNAFDPLKHAGYCR